jgi:hypothetical protein
MERTLISLNLPNVITIGLALLLFYAAALIGKSLWARSGAGGG